MLCSKRHKKNFKKKLFEQSIPRIFTSPKQINIVFGETIPTIFYHSKWFENGLKNGLKNSLTLQILRWYKWLRFKDIVYGFRKLKKMVEKIRMEWNSLED